MKQVIALLAVFAAGLAWGNAHAYLYGLDPYYPDSDSPKLTTPQWVGEPGVDAVVVLSIDDMRDVQKYEDYLRPILERLKQIDGRAPVSIMTNVIDVDELQLQTWLDEGLSLDTHTVTHPCPLLAKGDFEAASDTYHQCVDVMNNVPNNRAVAFRMPCCDSLNTPTPRFYEELFKGESDDGHHLAIDSSVFTVFTGDVGDQFKKYIPFPSFVNVIEDYPYPYVFSETIWEVPCVVPSDWEGHNLNGSNAPQTVADMKAAIDRTVEMEGVYTLVFHPHGWIRNDQVVELIDHVEETYGSRVKFLNFREIAERLRENLLAGETLRDATGGANGVHVLDVNRDGYMDVVIANKNKWITRIWDAEEDEWSGVALPEDVLEGFDGVHFVAGGDFDETVMVFQDGDDAGAWRFDGKKWKSAKKYRRGLRLDSGAQFRDVNGDGTAECITSDALFEWRGRRWERADVAPPARLATAEGEDVGFRFVDLDGDDDLDVVFSNEERYGVYRFESLDEGWTTVTAGERVEENEPLPPFVKDGENWGAWAHSGHIWWRNEYTDGLPDHVDRRAFGELLYHSR